MKRLALLLTTLTALSCSTWADDWQDILDEANGQTVYFHAWGGSQPINDYLSWVADRVEQEYGVNLEHVKVAETGAVVSQVLSEKTAGRDDNGSVDLVWINGENFAAMKANELLFGPFTQDLPNYALVDTENKPTTHPPFTAPAF